MSGRTPTEYERLVQERVNAHLRAHPTAPDDLLTLVTRIETEVEAELQKRDSAN